MKAMNYHLIDTVTLMRAIELLDQYSWLLNTGEPSPMDEKKESVLLTLRSLRNVTKRDIDCTKKPIC